MNTDLDDRLHGEFTRAASHAPALTCTVADIATTASRRRRRRNALSTAMAVLLVAGGVAGLAAVQSVRSNDSSTEPRSSTETESPLTQLPHAVIHSGAPTKPGAIALQLADGQQITFAVTGSPFYDGYAQQATIQINDSGGIGRAQPDGADVVIPQPEVGGNESLTFWSGLPDTASRVQYLPVTGPVLWQHPVAGIAAFPAGAHAPGDTLIAYNANGDEVTRTTWSTTHLVYTGQSDNGPMTSYSSSLAEPDESEYGPIDVSRIANLDDVATSSYTTYADDTMRTCLKINGDIAWTTCIQSTDAAVKTYLDNLPENNTARP